MSSHSSATREIGPPVVAVVGSRDFPSIDHVSAWIRQLAAKHPGAVIVSGGARGVDQAAEKAAMANGLDVISYRPYEYTNMEHRPEFSIETKTHGEAAQAIVVGKSRRINPPHFPTYGKAAISRNGWIVDDCDHLIAFWDGRSSGTRDSIRRARQAGKLRRVTTNEELVLRQLRELLDAHEVS